MSEINMSKYDLSQSSTAPVLGQCWAAEHFRYSMLSNDRIGLNRQPCIEILNWLVDCGMDRYIAQCGAFCQYSDDVMPNAAIDEFVDFACRTVNNTKYEGASFRGNRINLTPSPFDQLVVHCRLTLQQQLLDRSSKPSHRDPLFRLNGSRSSALCEPTWNLKSTDRCDVILERESYGVEDFTNSEDGNVWIPALLTAAKWLTGGSYAIQPLWQSRRSSMKNQLIDSAAALMAALIIYCQLHRFDDLITTVCHRLPRSISTVPDLVILAAVIDNLSPGQSDVIVVNRLLGLGSRALCLAARQRLADVITVLLRHGADVTARCELGMCCDSIEALLFAPCETGGGPHVRLDTETERCLRLLMAATNRVPYRRLESLEADGYRSRCSNWRLTLVSGACQAWSVAPSNVQLPIIPPLQQLSRFAIRSAVCRSASSNAGSTMGVARRLERLPLPTSLKRYVSLIDGS